MLSLAWPWVLLALPLPFIVRALLPNPDHALRPGMLMQVELQSQQRVVKPHPCHQQRQQGLSTVGNQHDPAPLHEPADLIDVRRDSCHQHAALFRRLMQHRQIVNVTKRSHPQPGQSSFRHPRQPQVAAAAGFQF